MELFKFGILFVFCIQGQVCEDFYSRKCPKLCHCNYKTGLVDCDNHGRNLPYIPKLTYVKNLQFNGNYLPNVTQATFMNVVKKNLKTLSLNNDSITHIAQNSFDNFPVLENLALGMNNLSSQSLQMLFSSLSKVASLRKLYLNSLALENMSEDFFANMAGTNVTVLQMRNNSNAIIDTSMFKYFSKLNVLDVKFNFIREFRVSVKLDKLIILNLVHNNLTAVPDFCSPDGSSLVPTLRSLYIQYNSLTSVTKETFRCLTTLTELNLSVNLFQVLEDDLLFYLSKLTFLELKWNKYTGMKVKPKAFKSKSLRKLEFRNQLDAKYTFVSLDQTFMYIPNLQFLSLQSISFVGMTPEDMRILFRPLVNLETILLYNCKINSVPAGIFENKPNLKKIELRRNKISALQKSSFKGLPKLASLFLAYNMIGEIDEGMLPLEQPSLKHVDLSNNPYLCSCQQLWFINWLKGSHKNIMYYPKEYKCSFPKSKRNMLLSDVSFTYRECHPFPPYVWAAMIGGPLLLVTVVIATVAYRNRWNIKHYIYLMRKRKNYERLPNNDYIFDAFIAHSQADFDWVNEVLLAKLEKLWQYKLCIHDRNFRAGLYVVDNIIQRQEESRKIILVVSNEFAKSDWCRFEMKMAQKRCIEGDNEVLIVILLEPLLAQNVPKSMKLLLNSTTYIQWTEDAVGKQLFWDKLEHALRRPS